MNDELRRRFRELRKQNKDFVAFLRNEKDAWKGFHSADEMGSFWSELSEFYATNLYQCSRVVALMTKSLSPREVAINIIKRVDKKWGE